MKAYVLAAGYATRMYPLTLNVPKPLLRVAGVPVLTYIIKRLSALPDLTEIVVITNHKFAPRFLEWRDHLGDERRITILDDGTTHPDNRLGAIADLTFALQHAPVDGNWIVVAGDNLIDFDLRDIYERFTLLSRPTVVVRETTNDKSSERPNEVTLGADGRVIGFREKITSATTGLSAISLYFFTKEVVEQLHAFMNESDYHDAPGYFIEWLVKSADVRGLRIDGRWFDVGDVDGLRRANEAFSDD